MYIAIVEQANLRVLEIVSSQEECLKSMNDFIRENIETFRTEVTEDDAIAYSQGKELVGRLLDRDEYVAYLLGQGEDIPDISTLPRHKIVVEILPMAA